MLTLTVLLATQIVAAPLPPLDSARVTAIAAMLPDSPTTAGRPITDRAYWDKIAADPRYAKVITTAEKMLQTPLQPWAADAFLDYSKNGNRTRYQNLENLRRGRLPFLAMAECIENEGRFLPALCELIDSLCQEKTWVLPAHDAKLDNYNGKTVDIDLGSSALAAQLGTTDYLLGDKLPAPTRDRLRANVKRRILVPFHDMITGKREPNWWITTTNNWNAVCLDGVTGAALALEPSKQERALFVAAAEKYSERFLSGFTADGYCGEGLGYWNYGFGNYYVLTEAVRQATGGKLDMLARPSARMPALFGARIQIMNDIAPAFADCPVFAKPMPDLMYAMNKRFSLGLTPYAKRDAGLTDNIYQALVYEDAAGAPKLASDKIDPTFRSPLRDYFNAAGILVARPGMNGTAKIGVALKGGNNDEPHNHNDLGSFVVVVGDRPVLLDPGAETYTARTFSSHRYDSKLLSSFGHPVPKFGEVLQRASAEARAKVVQASFTPESDTFALDITSGYTLPALKSLVRTWVYSRKGDGSLTMTDTVSLSQPTPYGTALLTLGGWRQNPDGTLFVYDGASAVNIKIDTGGKPYTIHPEVIHEDAPVTPTRLGIDLNDPVQDATVTLTITPVVETSTADTDGNLLGNGGFERGGFGWTLGSMGSVVSAPVATGMGTLRVHDTDASAGSDITSVPVPVPAAKGRLMLKGTANFASGSGIGLYLRFFDASGKLVSAKSASGNETPVGTLAGGAGAVNQWKPFAFKVAVPAGAAKAQLWIHSFSSAQCDAYLDDITLIREE